MVEIELTKVTDFEAVGGVWQEFELRVGVSFFQSWAWLGCLAAERFSEPVLLTARDEGHLIALGLFNHRHRRFCPSSLWLSESGDARHDDVFIEHNGLLIERSQPKDLLAACLHAAQTAPIVGLQTRRHRKITLSGVPEDYVSVGRRCCPMRICASRPAPFVDLQVLRHRRSEFLANTSANTRYQIRRAERQYAALGPLAVQRAGSVDEAHDFLTHLAAFHQVYWRGRGKTGSFANPHFERFHRTLIERGFAMGAIDLLKITTGTTVLGYLYNLAFRGHVYAYQSGFNYRLPVRHQKPGLTCHHLAIERYLAEGFERYDLLGGADQYKMSLANAVVELHWIEMGEGSPSEVLVEGFRSITECARQIWSRFCVRE